MKALVEKFVEPPQWGFLGQARVNVLLLNVALDQSPGTQPKKARSHTLHPRQDEIVLKTLAVPYSFPLPP